MDEVHPRIRSLVELWQLRCGEGDIPWRSSLDVFALKPWLGCLTIFEEVEKGSDYIVRLDGQGVVELTGAEWTGRRVSQLGGGQPLLKALRSVQASRQPLIDTVYFPAKGKLLGFSCALLPVWDDRRAAGQVIQCLWPVPDPS